MALVVTAEQLHWQGFDYSAMSKINVFSTQIHLFPSQYHVVTVLTLELIISSLASCWTKNWWQTASPCHQICKQWRSVISVLTSWSSVLLDSFAFPLTTISFAFLHSIWNPLDNSNSRIRPLFYGILSWSRSIIWRRIFSRPSNLLFLTLWLLFVWVWMCMWGGGEKRKCVCLPHSPPPPFCIPCT